MKLRLLGPLACLTLLAASLAPAQTPRRPMTFPDLMAMKRVSDPQISPAGKWVMFSVTDVSLEKNTKINHLWVVALAGGPERQITFGDEGQTNGRFSPDGKHVSMTSSAGGSSQIWIAGWDETIGALSTRTALDGARPLTSLPTEADGAIWSPDSQHLLFVSSVYPACSDKPIWADEDACNKARLDADAKSPVKAQVWDHLLFRHWNAYTGERRSHILMVSATDGEQIRDLTPASAVGDAETPTFSLGGPLGYAWSPDAKEIAYVTNLDKVPAASTNNDVFTLRLDEPAAPAARAVKVSTSPGSDDAPAYSPDGKYLAFRSQARNGYESDRQRLMLFNRQSKSISEVGMNFKTYSRLPEIVVQGNRPKLPPVIVTEGDLDRSVEEFVWTPDSQRVFFAASDRGQVVIYRTNVPDGNLHRFGKYTGAVTVGEWSDLIMVGPGDRLAGVLMRVDKPAEIAIANMSEMDDSGSIYMPNVSRSPSAMKEYNLRKDVPLATPNYLTHLNDGILADLDFSQLEPYSFAGAEGVSVEGFLIRPPNFDPAKRYPLKFLIHGGPQGAWGDGWSYRWNAELMAAGGYVVVMINPHGSTGYGQKFVEGVSGDWGGKPYVDLMRGLDFAEAKFPFIDKTRECALGGSYGGYMADWILTHTNRFQCIVTHDGMVDPVSAYGDTEEMWFNEWEFRRSPATGAAVFDPQPAAPWRYASLPADQDPFRKWSPMRFIQNAKTPTLIIHGQKDYRLDVAQGLELFTALQRLNVPSRMLYFPDEGHWVLKPQNSQLWNATVSDWCDQWTHTGKYAKP